MQELEEALNQMALGKAPGPDGFTSNFFHYFWDLIKDEVFEIISEYRDKKGVLKDFNATLLTLIPKEESPRKQELTFWKNFVQLPSAM